MTKCSELMTANPVCCEPGESIGHVAGLMKRENIGAIPVVDSHEDKQLIGIVTDRDIVVKVVAEGTQLDRATVRDAMTAQPTACGLNDDVKKAIELMRDQQVRRMPVVDESGHLRGIIAQADIATRMSRDKTTGELVESISEPDKAR